MVWMLARWVALAGLVAGCASVGAGCECLDVPLEEGESGGGGQEEEGGGQEDEGGGPVEDDGGGKAKKPDLKRLSKRGNQQVGSFESAKRKVYEIFESNPKDFYCGCDYADKEIDFESCGYKVRKSKTRAARTEVEHVVPASVFGKKFPAWTEGHADCDGKGRTCVSQVEMVYQYMEADLYNLRPAVGEVNADRSDKPMGEIPGEEREYGECDFEATSELAEPRPEVRGDVARTYFYMDWAYPGFGIMDASQRKLMEKWAKADPPDKKERAWAKQVEEVQGNHNPFLD